MSSGLPWQVHVRLNDDARDVGDACEEMQCRCAWRAALPFAKANRSRARSEMAGCREEEHVVAGAALPEEAGMPASGPRLCQQGRHRQREALVREVAGHHGLAPRRPSTEYDAEQRNQHRSEDRDRGVSREVEPDIKGGGGQPRVPAVSTPDCRSAGEWQQAIAVAAHRNRVRPNETPSGPAFMGSRNGCCSRIGTARTRLCTTRSWVRRESRGLAAKRLRSRRARAIFNSMTVELNPC